jgi:fatty acyl-CoA reductase
MVKLQKRITGGLEILQYYTTRNWNFPDTNMRLLYSKLDNEDRDKFNFDMKLVGGLNIVTEIGNI